MKADLLAESVGARPDPLASPPAADDPLLVDAPTAARLLGISARLLWDLTHQGKIKCKRIGRRVLYSRSVLEEFAKS